MFVCPAAHIPCKEVNLTSGARLFCSKKLLGINLTVQSDRFLQAFLEQEIIYQQPELDFWIP